MKLSMFGISRKLLALTPVIGVALLFTTLLPNRVNAAAGVNQQLNFQGRLLTSQGATVPDGYYNIEFKIYQDGDGQSAGDSTGSPAGSLKWTEDHINTGTTQGVTVKNGYLSVQLGTIIPFGSSINWNSDTLWLSAQIGNTSTCTISTSFQADCGGDGEMLPMKRLSSEAYAMNAGLLGGLNSSQFLQLGQGLQTDATTVSSLFINKTSTGNLIELQSGGNDSFVVGNTGDITFGSNANHNISVSTAGANNAGNSLTVSAGTAGTGSTALAGGNLVLQGGSGGGTNGNGGNVNINAGVANGSGTAGAVNIGTTTASSINIGKASITTTIAGTTVVTLSTSTGTTYVCQNGSGQLSTCGGGNDFIQNNPASAQTGNFNIIAGAAGTIAGALQSAASSTTAVMQLKLGATPGAGAALATFRDSSNTLLAQIDTNADFLTGGKLAAGSASSSAGMISAYDLAAGSVSIFAKGQSGKSGDFLDFQNAGGYNVFQVTSAGAITSADSTTASTGNLSLTTGNATTAAGLNSGSITIDAGTATGTTGSINIATTNASAVAIGRSGITTTIAGNTAVSLSSTTGTTIVCQNGSSQLSGCTNSYETTNGTDFIKNAPASQQTASFNISGAGVAGSLQATTGAFTGTGALTLGATGTATGSIAFKGSTAASGTLTLSLANNSPNNVNLNFYNSAAGTYTICTSDVNTCGGTTGTYIALQGSTPGSAQTGNFNISGTGIAATLQGSSHIYTPDFDTASAVALAIGTNNATSINLNQNVNIAAGKNIVFGSTGNFDQSASSGTFKTGTGAVSINGDATVAANKGLTFASGTGSFDQSASSGTFKTGTGAVSLNGSTTTSSNLTVGATAGNGAVFTNNGATVNTTGNLSLGSSGSIGSAATTVDIYSSLSISATASGLSFTLPAPTAATAYGRTVYISNIGSNAFAVGANAVTLNPGASTGFVWANTGSGASWQQTNGGSIFNQTGSAQNASFNISGSGKAGSLQASTGAFTGTGSLTLGTTGTATGSIAFKGSTAASGTVTLSLASNNPNTFTLNLYNSAAGTYTICTSDVNSCGGTTGTYIALQGTTPGSAQTGNFNINGTGLAAILQGSSHVYSPDFDTASAGALAIGANNANAINIGKSGVTTTIAGSTVVSLSATAGTTFVCQNGSNVLSACSNTGTYELTTGNDFIKNAPASQQTASFNISGAGVAGSIQATTGAFTGAGALTLGTTGTATGSIAFKGSTAASGTVTLSLASNAPNNVNLNFYNSAAGTYTICTSDVSSCGGTTGTYIALQGTTPGSAQTGNFNISGTGVASTLQASTHVYSPDIDAASGVTVAIGANNASAISLGKSGLMTTNYGNGQVNGSFTVGSAAGSGSLTNNGSTVNATLAISNSTGVFGDGTAANTVDKYTAFSINAGTTGLTYAPPTPTANTVFGRVIYISNIGTNAFTLGNSTLNAGATATLIWANTSPSASWQFAGADSSSILNQNTTTQTANFKISGTGTAGSLQAATGAFTGAGSLTLGTTGTASGSIAIKGSTAASGTVTIGLASNAPNNVNLNVYNSAAGTYTICTSDVNSCGGATGTYIALQGGTPGSAQTGNFNISGTGLAAILQGSSHVYAPDFDTAAAGALAIGANNANGVKIGNSTITTNAVAIQASGISQTFTGSATAPSAVIKTSTNSGSALQVQNSAGSSVFGVDTAANQVALGQANAINGSLLFKNSSSANGITINSTGANSSYTLTLPSATPAGGLCIETSTGNSSQLVFASCSNNNANIQEVAEWDANNTNVLTISPSTVGDEVVLTTQIPTSGVTVTGITGGGVSTWNKIVTSAGNGTVNRVEMWAGTATTLGSSAVTVTYSSSPGAEEVTATEFTASGVNASTSWGVESSGALLNSAASTSVTYPSATAVNGSELYIGYAQVQNPPASAGSTTGFSYTITSTQHNAITYNTALAANTAYQPSATQTTAGQSNTVEAVLTAFVTSTSINNATSLQKANFNVQAATAGSVAGVLQAASSGTADIMELRNSGATNVFTVGSTGIATHRNSTDSSSAFAVQNAAGNTILGVNTSASTVTLGTSSVLNGALTFNSSGSTNNITLQAPSAIAASYTLNLPSNSPTAGLCLATSPSNANQLVFSSCATQVSAASISYVNRWGTTTAPTATPFTASFADAPSSAGNLIVLYSHTTANVTISGISGGGVSSWTKVTSNAFTTGQGNDEMWRGVVSPTGAGSGTISVTYTGAPTAVDLEAEEFTMGSSTGTWAIDTSGTANAASGATTVNFPSLTPLNSSELYTGYAWGGGTMSAGTTTGFTYQTTTGGKYLAYNAAVTGGVAYAPTATQTSGAYNSIAAVIAAYTGTSVIVNSTAVQQANFDVQAATAGSVAGVLQAATSGTADIFQAKDSLGNNIASINSASGLSLGASGVVNGQLNFTAKNGNVISIASPDNPGSAYSLALPTTTPAPGQCLATSPSNANQLTFSSCANQVTSVAISNVNSWKSSTVSLTATLAVSPANLGDLMTLAIYANKSNTIQTVTGGGVSTWSRIIGANSQELWRGVVTSTGSSTITVTVSTPSGPTVELDAQEWTTGSATGSWVIDTSATVNNTTSSTTVTYPSITPQSTKDLYVGFADGNSTMSAGTTAGFTYAAGPTTTSELVYNVATSTTSQPTATQATAGTSIAVAALIAAYSSSSVISNSTNTQQANFNIQAATPNSVAGTLQAFYTGTGDILDLLDGNGVMTGSFSSTGNLLVKPSTASAAALQVQTTTGTNVFSTDTSNKRVVIGAGSTGESTPSVLVLDNETGTTADPTVLNGAMYYNATTHSFRCGVDGAWQNCTGLLYSNTSNSTAVSNCSNNCAAFSTSAAIPANYCQAGRVIKLSSAGYFSSAATTSNLQFGVYYGTDAGTAANDTLLGTLAPAASVTSANNNFFQMNFNIICFSTSSMQTAGILNIQTGSSSAGMTALPMSSTSATTVSSNAAKNLYIFPIWDTASSSNTATVTQFTVNGS